MHQQYSLLPTLVLRLATFLGNGLDLFFYILYDKVKLSDGMFIVQTKASDAAGKFPLPARHPARNPGEAYGGGAN